MLDYLLAAILFLVSLIGDAHEAQPTPVPPTATIAVVPTATPAPPAGALDLPGIVCAPVYQWSCSRALGIVDCESEGDPWATGALNEKGIWQIHPVHGRGDLDYDPVASTAFAYQLWLARGWSDWSCSGGGGY